MRTLFIGKIWPEPTSSAAGSRTLQALQSLASAEWELHFACAAHVSEYSVDLASTCGVQTHAIKLNDSGFEPWLAELAPDIVVFDRFMTEEQFGWRVERALPEALRVLDTSDLHCLREARHQQLRSGSALDLHNHIALREIASILRSDLTLVISEYELDLLAREFQIPSALLAYWPFCLPSPAKDSPPFRDRRDFLMIGSFLHEPNADAVHWCREAIWPRIRRQLPNAQLHVYGSYATGKVLQLHNPSSGFNVVGRAENAIETMKRYRLNLVPLRFGAGLKGKVTDAFLAGTPSIATPIGIEGIPGALPWGSVASDAPEIFAQEAVALYETESAWTRAQSCGFDIARERFSEAEWQPKLPNRIESAFGKLQDNRKRNFTGRMLRHHLHRSTEFMSRWIETKNQQQQHEPN